MGGKCRPCLAKLASRSSAIADSLAQDGWQLQPILFVIAGVALAIVFLQRQRKLEYPLIDLKLCLWCNWGTGDLTTHGFRASFPASLLRRLGAALRRQRGGDDRLVRVHVGDGREMQMPGQTRPGAAASLLLCMWVVMMMMMVAMMLLPSLVPMLWRYSARPCDRTGKNPEVLIGFFAKNAISRLQKVLSAKI
jgi:hypothetical protein